MLGKETEFKQVMAFGSQRRVFLDQGFNKLPRFLRHLGRVLETIAIDLNFIRITLTILSMMTLRLSP